VEEPRVARLAGDIARNLPHLSPDEAAQAIAGHLRSFWDPRMRRQLQELVAADPSSVEPVVVAAVAALEEHR
jgi:formate dehydrogenase subunit delta